MHNYFAPKSGDTYMWVGLPGQPALADPVIRVDSLSADGRLQTMILDEFMSPVWAGSMPLSDFVAAVDLGYLVKMTEIRIGDLQPGDRIRLGKYRNEGPRWMIEVVHSIVPEPRANGLRVYFVDSAPIDFDPDDLVILHHRPVNGQMPPNNQVHVCG